MHPLRMLGCGLALLGVVAGPASAQERATVSSGTGFVVRPDGVLLTAFHIVQDAATVSVQCPGYAPQIASLTDSTRSNDLALLRVPLTGMPYLSLARPRSLKLGDPVFTVGFPVRDLLGRDPKFTDGSVSALSGLQGEATIIQMSVPVQPGNSGGPLLTNDGSVVGVVIAQADDRAFLSATGSLPQNINWAVKSEYALPLFEQPAIQAPATSRRDAIARVLKATCTIEASRANIVKPSPAAPSAPPPTLTTDELNRRAHEQILSMAPLLGFKAETPQELDKLGSYEVTVMTILNANPELQKAFSGGDLTGVSVIFRSIVVYQRAYWNFQNGRYPLAVSDFQKFLRQFPVYKSEWTAGAHYHIGEAYFRMARMGTPDKVRENLEQAVQEFRKVEPWSRWAPGALYKEALSLVELKQTDLAAERIAYLVEHFPRAPEAALAQGLLRP